MRNYKTTICVLLSVLCGALSKEKEAFLEISEYQDATIPLDMKSTDIQLIPINSVSNSRASRAESSTAKPVEGNATDIAVTAGEPTETKPKEHINSTRPTSHTIIDPFSIKLLRGETNGISVTDLAHSKSILYFNYTQSKTYSVDYHYTKRMVFFTAMNVIFRDEVVGRLTRVKPPSIVVSAGVDGPVRLAVDWVHDRLYWLSDKHQTVESASLDGANRTLLFDNVQNITFPNNLAVDPYAGYLFLVSNHSVFRADLDGANLTRLQLPAEDTRGVKCLALDLRQRRVYYSGKEGNPLSGIPYIASCNYEGGEGRDHPLAYKWNDIFALDVFRDTLYFASYRPKLPDKLYSVDLTQAKLTPKYLQTVDTTNGDLWSIRIYHPGVQQDPRGKNCSDGNLNEKLGA
ncbi:low-density lipoprotein receptor-related protein 4-like [Macrosteles quadrilineatus]|uniref:low-density lipoprotein receptor-related protein 4-like n=1 Tax=Macrosteles quadrilineatus TaxID=74068 RepID=UPI0023E117D7|nr:low-density lipoprotein receptor-related protein 4-like [Macrosteles quadrilineatus]